jgi:hypothetical protein
MKRWTKKELADLMDLNMCGTTALERLLHTAVVELITRLPDEAPPEAKKEPKSEGTCGNCGQPWYQEKALHGCKKGCRTNNMLPIDRTATNTRCPKCGWCAICDEVS